MDSKKVLYFLNILNEETNGYSDELAKMYQSALDDNEDVIRLRTFVKKDIYKFLGERGLFLKKKVLVLEEKIYDNPIKALEILPQLKQELEIIEKEIKFCDSLMRSPMPFTESITVLKKKDINTYMMTLKKIAIICVYLITIYVGMEPIQNLMWEDACGIGEKVFVINTKFLPTLCQFKMPNYNWVIRKKRLGGKALFGGIGFYLSYENMRSVQMICSDLHTEPIGTHAFLNIDAYESGEMDVPYCWGIGNIVSSTPENAFSFLQKDVQITVRPPKDIELSNKLPKPFECIKKLSEGAMFCISPDDLVKAMNQWQIGYEIKKRKRTHNCLFCGKSITSNRLVCDSYFRREL